MILKVIDEPLYISWKWTSKLYMGDTQPMYLMKIYEFAVSQESHKWLTEQQQSELRSQVGLASHKASVSQQTVQRSPCTRGYGGSPASNWD